MSRFENLEFTPKAPEELQSSVGAIVKDEAFFLSDAQQAWEEGDCERGLRSFARVLEHNPKNAHAWAGQVKMLVELGEFREAKLWADKALEQFPREPELLAAKAVALARLGDLEAALAFSDAAFEERGDSPYIWLARGDVLLARGEPVADYCFGRAINHDGASWFFAWLASRVYYFYQRFALALKTVETALTIDGSQSVLWLQLGLCRSQLGLTDSAIKSLEHALQLNPRNAIAVAALGGMQKQDWSHGLRARIRRFFPQ